MAKKKVFRKAGPTVPVAIALGFVPLIGRGIDLYKSQGFSGLQALPSSLIPYDFQQKKVTGEHLGSGLYPILAGMFVHKVVGGMLGVNKVLARARVPFLRI